ncbi:MAG TPA: hypothetical protein VF927_08535 [Solirubrobacteraceae bacterium]
MSDRPDPTPSGVGAGLCDTCVHQQIVRNTRGSSFSLCRRSREDPAYPRYPRVPVLACPGHTPRGVLHESRGTASP